MARQFPSPNSIIFFDIETGGPLKKRSRKFSASEFFQATTKPGWKNTADAAFHANNPLLQLHATNIPHFQGSAVNFPPHGGPPLNTFIKPPEHGWIYEDGQRVSMQLTDWAREHNLAFSGATQTEEEALHAFFGGIEAKIAAAPEGEKVYLSGWNVGYDLGGVERAVRRHESLTKYHGWMGQQYAAGKLDVIDASEPMLETVLEYARRNQEFAGKYLRLPSGKVASTVDELRQVPGWALGKVMSAAGGLENRGLKTADLHAAFYDTILTEDAYTRWTDAYRAIDSEAPDFNKAFHEAGLLNRETEAKAVLEGIYHNPAAASRLEDAARAGLEMGKGPIFERSLEQAVNWKRFGLAAAALGVATVATRMAFSKRRDRQTQIVGLQDEGLAPVQRHRLTPFGSGWHGLENQDRVDWQRAAKWAAAYGAYRFALSQNPTKIYRGLRRFEDFFGDSHKRNLMNVLSTSHWTASYVPEELFVPLTDVRNAAGKVTQWGVADQTGNLTDFGRHLERLVGQDARLLEKATQEGGLRFRRSSKWSAYHTLEGTDREVRFVGFDKDAAPSRWAGASERWGKPFEDFRERTPFEPSGSLWEQWQQRFRNRRSSRFPRNPQYGALWEDLKFQPMFGRQRGAWYESLRQRAGIVSLEMMERPQRLFSRIGLGARAGTWNSALGLGGVFLAGAVGLGLAAVGADYTDYLTGHRLSAGVAGVIPKARIAHAELTDRIPGARRTTDWYQEHMPGQWYGPAMFPAIGWTLGKAVGLAAKSKWITPNLNPAVVRNFGKFGMIAGAASMLPFVPGMLGSRHTANELRAIYSGEEPVPVRSGRWWEMGNTPWSGRRISMYRPSWYARLKARPERVALWGNEEEYWKHHPLLHPLRWLKDPYALEEATYRDRPYPMTSPALSNVPLVGPMLAATVGRLLKPPKRMHEEDWDGTQYTLFSPRVEPRGPDAVPNPLPKEEFRSARELVRREGEIAAEFVGFPGFAAKALKSKLLNNTAFGQEVFYEGSRQMTSLSRRYYDQEFGAGWGPTPDLESSDTYSEGFRRFVQRDLKTLQANEIPNTMPHWMPGENYMINFRTGDPYRKVASGASRLPGPGYAALHPELEGVAYEDYPLLEQFKILSDVAPWSTEWFQRKSMVEKTTHNDTRARIEYERILERAEKMKASSEQFDERRYSAPVEEISGTIKQASLSGVELAEMPGRTFQLSALGMRAADLSSVVLGEHNQWNEDQVASEVESRQRRLEERLEGMAGASVRLVVPKGAAAHAKESRAVLFAGSTNLNRELLNEGLALKRSDQAGAEFQAMSASAGKSMGRLAEAAAFEGDASYLNPMHWVADPSHSKFWQERTALEEYKHHEVYGKRMQNWATPVKSFLNPWKRGLVYRLTGIVPIPKQVKERRDLDTLTDYMEYLRALNSYTNNRGARTAVGADLFGSPEFLRSALSGRDKYYYGAFLAENDERKRREILDVVPGDFARILQAQWVKRDAELRDGSLSDVAEGGRLKTAKEYGEYQEAREGGKTKLNFGDWERTQEIASFFFRRHIRLPDSPDSPAYDPNIDYEDVKAKIIQEEGGDLHDYNIFDDRAATLWRKPYIDGAVVELTQGDTRPVEQLRQLVENMILSKHNPDPDVRIIVQPAMRAAQTITVNVEEKPEAAILADVRANPDQYRTDGVGNAV